jgi:DNA-binding MarR family transcriptional regulator
MSAKSTQQTLSAAKFAYEGLDRVIHERARLSILTSLITNPAGLRFVDLKQLCDLTDGNLARHLQVLEKENMIESSKDHAKARTHTITHITAAGRKRYLDYLTTLEQVVRDAATAGREATTNLSAPKLQHART